MFEIRNQYFEGLLDVSGEKSADNTARPRTKVKVFENDNRIISRHEVNRASKKPKTEIAELDEVATEYLRLRGNAYGEC